MKGTRWMAAGGLALALLALGGGSCARGVPGVVLRDASALAGLPAEADRVSAKMRVEEVEARPARVMSVQGCAVVRGTVLEADEGCAVGAGERVEVWVGGMDERVPPTPAVGASVEMVFDRNRDGVVWLDPPKRMTAWLSIFSGHGRGKTPQGRLEKVKAGTQGTEGTGGWWRRAGDEHDGKREVCEEAGGWSNFEQRRRVR